jgi:Transposase DDE domain
MSVPAELSDPVVLADRLDAATAELDSHGDDSDSGDTDEDPPGRALSPDQVSVSGPVPADRAGRLEQALELADAIVATERAARREAAAPYLAAIAAGQRIRGRAPAGARVALLEQRLAEKIAESEAKHQRWQARRNKRSPGRPPVPTEDNAKIRDLREELAKARAAEDKAGDVEAHTVNLTDPQSRIQPLRGGGWLQGYNCQAVATADGLIVATGVGTSPVDTGYYCSMIDKAEAAADLMSHHRLDTDTADAEIGMVLADAGYCSRDNLRASGPDRLIATAKARDLHTALGDPIESSDGSDPIVAMTTRLRDPNALAVYQQRSHIAETPFGHAKHNWGFRRFTSRGVDRARSEWTFHAAVHNIAKILTHLAGNPLPA